MAPGPDRSPELGIQRFDGIRRVQNPPDIAGKGVERDDLAPGAPPALADGRVFLAPEALLEGGERGLAGIGVDGSVNALQSRGHRLAVFPGHKIEAVAQQVDDAGLHRRLREDGGDRFGEAFQGVDAGDQQVFDAAVFQLVHDPQPEFSSLVLLEPDRIPAARPAVVHAVYWAGAARTGAGCQNDLAVSRTTGARRRVETAIRSV